MEKETDYLRMLLPDSKEHIVEIEEYAELNRVPIMEKESMHFIKQLIRIKQPAKILEIGTAIGYSAIQMAEAHPSVHIVSIERDADRYEEAVRNAERSGYADRLHFHHGDALKMKDLIAEHGLFDVLFIDAAKGKYQQFFEIYEPMLHSDALIISDNVLFKNLVADPDHDNKRMNKIAAKIRRFNEWLTDLDGYETSIVPIGDGVAITTAKDQ
ncbi:O-methyltransferase [Salimicrobium sp. PL1-032A]|uniref:O-methyltransferase n=1 Tax=Salimicrobium sp. PL1-032A TaxID=3095364 RepID=UPI003260F736